MAGDHTGPTDAARETYSALKDILGCPVPSETYRVDRDWNPCDTAGKSRTVNSLTDGGQT